MLKINDTPIRTCRNFRINNVTLENVSMPAVVRSFDNVTIINESSKITVENVVQPVKLTYGIGEEFVKQANEMANRTTKFTINSKTHQQAEVQYEFDQDNLDLVDVVEIEAEEDTKSTITIKYTSEEGVEAFHNGTIKLLAKPRARVHVVVVNLTSENTNNFLSIENEIQEQARVDYTIIDLGGKNSISNYYANIVGEKADNRLDSIYLGTENQLYDINYIGHLRGEKSNIKIDVQGALKGTARKNFKGTIDFKQGCKNAVGDENESCMLLSDTAKSLALPMLLCSEEDVEGNHSTSSGKIGENELFYVMSRGFSKKEAMKLMVRAKFNKIVEEIKDEDLKQEILAEIDRRLD